MSQHPAKAEETLSAYATLMEEIKRRYMVIDRVLTMEGPDKHTERSSAFYTCEWSAS